MKRSTTYKKDVVEDREPPSIDDDEEEGNPIDALLSAITGLGVGLLFGGVLSHALKDPVIHLIIDQKVNALKTIFAVPTVDQGQPQQETVHAPSDDTHGHDQRVRAGITKPKPSTIAEPKSNNLKETHK